MASTEPTRTPMISTRSPVYRALAAGKYATTVVFVALLYSWYPTTARMSASTTASSPMITDARGRLTEMLLNSGYLPSRPCLRLHLCRRCRAPAGYCRVPAGPGVRVAMPLAGVPPRDSPEPGPAAVPAAPGGRPGGPARTASGCLGAAAAPAAAHTSTAIRAPRPVPGDPGCPRAPAAPAAVHRWRTG